MGDPARFRTVFEATYGPVRRYVHRRGVTGGWADDVVAETFLIAWRRLDDVTTRHFRSASPEDLPIDAIRDWVRNRGDVTALDIWVDQDDLVRRLEIGFAGGDPNEAGPNETPVSASTASIRLYDFGEVPPLEAPPVDVEP